MGGYQKDKAGRSYEISSSHAGTTRKKYLGVCEFVITMTRALLTNWHEYGI